MNLLKLLFVLLLPSVLAAQTVALPAGTAIPIRLDTAINAARIHPGQHIRARIMQNIPGTPIHRGAHVVGHVLSVTPTRVELRFDAVVAGDRRIPLTADLRAVASMLEVDQAQIPEDSPERGLPPEDWNTRQIGGDEVYRGGGHVERGDTVVGEPTPYGVRGPLLASGPCRAAVAGNNRPQALWLFSTDACGVYGIPALAIEHAGRTAPAGTIRLVSRAGTLNIRSGSGLLLRVLGS